jgi:hypothetical protein
MQISTQHKTQSRATSVTVYLSILQCLDLSATQVFVALVAIAVAIAVGDVVAVTVVGRGIVAASVAIVIIAVGVGDSVGVSVDVGVVDGGGSSAIAIAAVCGGGMRIATIRFHEHAPGQHVKLEIALRALDRHRYFFGGVQNFRGSMYVFRARSLDFG